MNILNCSRVFYTPRFEVRPEAGAAMASESRTASGFQETAQPCPKCQGVVARLGQDAFRQCVGACGLNLDFDLLKQRLGFLQA